MLSPIELIRRAMANGYRSIAITDHVGFGTQPSIIEALIEECARASSQWDIVALPGVELTHIPKELINEAAQKARSLGARVVVVHGETLVEPVEPGTNLAALSSPYVDILAHPGLLTEEEARMATKNNIFLELSTRRGHCLSNGHVARIARATGAKLILDSDAHAPEDLLTPKLAYQAAQGAGLTHDQIGVVTETHALELLGKAAAR